ncbi:hypothetical protein Q2T40_10555 [Winogradskyella maritima]|uniref:Response receiver domain-containing protein n=1 Tax=Winogradskyella maritima TaxID=1517766 RepID=A0ABV8AJW1_9FLAO|nr:hypothetical protein [Winogradskyella maritima]
MAGVILYADDHIYSDNRPENFLYNELRKDLPVLGIENLKFVEESTKSIGAFKAVILDWQFGNDEPEESFEDIEKEIGIPNPITQGSVKENETFTFLNENDFYSLIYIFSQEHVENSPQGEALKEKFGDRIRFKIKDADFTSANISIIKTQILKEINDWETQNRNLSAPIKWSEAINIAIQKVFKELSSASDNWLKHIYASADGDGVDPELFVIELMQLLLAENLLQDRQLIKTIRDEGNSETDYELADKSDYDKSISRLFSILSYSNLTSDAPLMTGDVCVIDQETFGIIITPECDIRIIKNKPNYEFELLTFKKGAFQNRVRSFFSKSEPTYEDLESNKQDTLRKYFNQNEPRLHFLPCLPITDGFNTTMVIDFRLSAKRITSSTVNKLERPFKINSPFIQQVRQRYLSYIGRVGVPALPNNVKDWNLK